MTEETLIGYLIGALDDDSQDRVEVWLRSNPDAPARLERLQRALEPLACDRENPEPPAGLATSTIDFVENARPATLPFAPRPSGAGGFWSWARRADVLVASVLAMVILGLGAVWLIQSRQRSDQLACQENMRRIHHALTAYSDQRQDRAYPRVPPQGPHAFAGVYVPALADAGVLPSEVSVRCPATGVRTVSLEPDQLRKLEQLQIQDPEGYKRLVADLSDGYAYSLGYRQGGALYGLRQEPDNDLLPILADRPPDRSQIGQVAGNSPNHGGRGQNVLYIGGNVRFVSHRGVGIEGDDIYLNQDRRVSAGVHQRDTVLGASQDSP